MDLEFDDFVVEMVDKVGCGEYFFDEDRVFYICFFGVIDNCLVG